MNNTTQYTAPSLHHNGRKDEGNKTNQSYILPQRLTDIIFNELGNSSAQLRIMCVLCGTKEGFFITEKWICERTGLKQQSYSRALAELVKRGWVSHRKYSNITINYDAIFACEKQAEDTL